MEKYLSGRPVADFIYKGVKEKLKNIDYTPCIAVILIGNRKDSTTYVNMKIKKCEEIGIKSVVHILDTNCTQSKVEEIIHTLNKDDSVTGILVQLPLPEHLDEEKILNSVSYHKDIDGFNIIN